MQCVHMHGRRPQTYRICLTGQIAPYNLIKDTLNFFFFRSLFVSFILYPYCIPSHRVRGVLLPLLPLLLVRGCHSNSTTAVCSVQCPRPNKTHLTIDMNNKLNISLGKWSARRKEPCDTFFFCSCSVLHNRTIKS